MLLVGGEVSARGPRQQLQISSRTTDAVHWLRLTPRPIGTVYTSGRAMLTANQGEQNVNVTDSSNDDKTAINLVIAADGSISSSRIV